MKNPSTKIGALLANISNMDGMNRVSSHEIDLSDHYSHFDKSIGPYNFLKFSERVWSLFNNRLLYQNRLRASDYRKLFVESSWHIHSESVSIPSDFSIEDVNLNNVFANYEADDLAVTNLTIGARC